MKKTEFAKRRKTLMRMVGEDGIAILPSAPVRTRSRDVEYRYRQDSDFYYLSGFAEPDSVAIIAPGRESGEYVLFCRERDELKEQWDGSRAGPDGAVERYGADDAFPIDDIDDILPGILETRGRVYYTMGAYADFDLRITEWVKSLRHRESSGIHTPHEFIALDHLLHDMRLYKSRAEISAMRTAAKIAVKAHHRAMAAVAPGKYEYEIEAEYVHEFRRHDAAISYSPIVGTGANACTLHYVENNAKLADGDLLLIDAGCEYDYYASDVTRTMPVNGRFTPEQRAVYEIVLEAQLAAIDKTVKGNHWNDPHDAAVRIITKGLKKIGLLDGTLAKLIKDRAYREYFMHRTGHWIGMDVHDVGDYKVGDEWRFLEPGMVTTVEPGIYIPASSKVPARWRNIGVRIEDDVAVTNNGPDVLSKGLAKDPDDVEKKDGGLNTVSGNNKESDYDIIIAGGGMIGTSLGLALAPLNLKVAVVEAIARGSEQQPSFDDRSTALSRSSQRMFEAMGLWPEIVAACTPIRHIHVSDKGRFGFAHIDAEEQKVEALGYVVINRVLGRVLQDSLAAVDDLDVICPAKITAVLLSDEQAEVTVEEKTGTRMLTCRLLVAADGANSAVREMVGIGVKQSSYDQWAVIGNLLPEKLPDNRAFERFTEAGPLAMLPVANDRAAFVWIQSPEAAEETLALSDVEFTNRIQEAFGHRLGRFSKVGKRAAYPLFLSKANSLISRRSVVVGNAAHGLHPVAAQGFNLGMRDVAALCDCIADARLDQAGSLDCGDAAILENYAEWRAADHRKLVRFTDGIVHLFGDSRGPVRLLRNIGMLGFDLIPGIRTLFAKHTMGLAGKLPRLSRGVPLE